MVLSAVLFDLGGVLVQSGEPVARRRWAKRLGISDEDLYRAYVDAIGLGWEGGRSEDEIWHRLRTAVGVSDLEGEEFQRALHAHDYLDPAFAEFIACLRPRYRTAAITNAGPACRQEMSARFALHDRVDLLVVSAEEGCSKPDPRIYNAALGRLGVEAAGAVFIDDKPANVAGAVGVGMQGVVRENAAQVLRDVRAILGVIETCYDAAGGVVVDGDRVLVLERPSRGELRLPKGHIETGETPQAAAVREVGEETGYVDVEVEMPLGIQRNEFDVFPLGEAGWHVDRTEHYFRMRLRSRRTVARGREEHKFVPRWMSVPTALDSLTFEIERDWLERAVAGSVPTRPGPVTKRGRMKYAEGPTTEVDIVIDAPAERVWALVSDIGLPARFSSELAEAHWLDGATGPAVGARFVGRSRHPAVGEWETTCVVTFCEPGRCFGWAVGDPDHPSASWRFDLDAEAGGVRLRQWAQLGPAPSGLTPAIQAMPDKEERIVARRLDEHRANMAATVEGIKALAEAERP